MKWLVPALLLAVGCSQPVDYVKVATYRQRIKKVEIGMNKSDFELLFPEADRKGAQNQVEVLELRVYEYWSVPSFRPGVYRDPGGGEWETQWFYFYGDRLVQFGRPNDWPRNPDRILEIRHR